jgi:hypothetical protein
LITEEFPALGLAFNALDALIWATCQREGLVLITGNRNDDGPDSLEATIRNENQPDSLPVFTMPTPIASSRTVSMPIRSPSGCWRS